MQMVLSNIQGTLKENCFKVPCSYNVKQRIVIVMEKTTSYQELNREVTGYMLNAPLAPRNQQHIRTLQQELTNRFGDIVYALPIESLHITLMDWVAPLVDYHQDKDALFQTLFHQYDNTLINVLQDVKSINVTFDTLKVSNGAIFLIGHDDGQFQTIRDSFTRDIELVHGTKKPPTIIHTTIARFIVEADLAPISAFALDYKVEFIEQVDSFRLVNEKKIPMLEYDTLKSYRLG